MNFTLNQFDATHLILPLLILVGEVVLIANMAGVEFAQVPFAGHSNASVADFPVPETVGVEPHGFDYRSSGVFVFEGREVDAELQSRRLVGELQIMRNQVSEREYSACVADGACKAADIRWPAAGENRPVTGVSFDDAVQYAAWLSKSSGEIWRLPTDAEWVAAAGSRAHDEAIGINDEADNPAARWLASYALRSEARAANGPPRPTGDFGVNEYGLADVSGNVWEWTATCFSRTHLSSEAEALSVLETCGVRVVQGLHRTYISTFIRDAKAGGCSVGAPPSHLGFRLVREPQLSPASRMQNWLGETWRRMLPTE